MAELINLRRARKGKKRAADAKNAEANRMAHGIARPVKKWAKAQADKARRELDGKELEPHKHK